jgi:cell division protein FtsB
LKSHGKGEKHILEAENKKLVEDQEKLKAELKKTSDGNFLCTCKKVKRLA